MLCIDTGYAYFFVFSIQQFQITQLHYLTHTCTYLRYSFILVQYIKPIFYSNQDVILRSQNIPATWTNCQSCICTDVCIQTIGTQISLKLVSGNILHFKGFEEGEKALFMIHCTTEATEIEGTAHRVFPGRQGMQRAWCMVHCTWCMDHCAWCMITHHKS